jgi:hypothetical protein
LLIYQQKHCSSNKIDQNQGSTIINSVPEFGSLLGFDQKNCNQIASKIPKSDANTNVALLEAATAG